MAPESCGRPRRRAKRSSPLLHPSLREIGVCIWLARAEFSSRAALLHSSHAPIYYASCLFAFAPSEAAKLARARAGPSGASAARSMSEGGNLLQPHACAPILSRLRPPSARGNAHPRRPTRDLPGSFVPQSTQSGCDTAASSTNQGGHHIEFVPVSCAPPEPRRCTVDILFASHDAHRVRHAVTERCTRPFSSSAAVLLSVSLLYSRRASAAAHCMYHSDDMLPWQKTQGSPLLTAPPLCAP